MITQKKTLKKWFSNFMKPAQEHFSAWIDSFWHKSEQIPMSSIEGLSRAIENTASAGQMLNHINDTNAHRGLFDELKNQIQAIQTILRVDDVNLDTLQEIVTELKSNTKLQELIDKKVNKEEGKGLSSNDFTNELKQKLEGISPLVGKYFSSNLIQGNTEYLKSDVYQSGITHELRLIAPLIKGKCLLSYVGKKLGEGVTMKFLNPNINSEEEIKGELLHTDNETDTQYYLLETDDTGYLKGANFYTNKIKVELQGSNSIGNLQLKRILTLPEWEAEKGFYNTYAKEIGEGRSINAGRCNLVPTYGRDREVSVFYQEGMMFSVVKSGYYDEGKITFSGINGTIEGDTEITGKVGSRAEAICMNGKIYITVHNKV